MTDRWDALLAALRERFAPDTDADQLAAFLSTEGFDRRQIGEIVARFCGDVAGERVELAGPLAVRPPPVRVLGPHELGRFTPDAWGQILTLHASGLLTVVELEHVIERALGHADGRVTLPELRVILDGIGLGDSGGDLDLVTIH